MKKPMRIQGGSEDIYERQRRRKMKKKRARIAFRSIMLTFLAIIVICVLLFLTPWFNIKEINVSGNATVEQDSIILQSGIGVGKNIFKISTSQSEQNLLRMPYIKDAEVKRKLPNKIFITVTESYRAAYFEYGGEFVAIDENGKVLEILSEQPVDCMQILGCDLKEISVGEKIKIDSDEKFDIIVLYMNEFSKRELAGKVTALDLTNTVDTKFTYDGRLSVYCGDGSDLDRKILTFIEVAFNQLSANARGEIDLRIDGKTYYRP